MITNLVPEIEYVNEAFVRTTGYEREELIGKNPHFISSGLTPIETYMSMWRALSEGESWRGEMINQRKTGEFYTESELVSPMRRPDGEITHYLAIKEDITERKKLALELEQHRHELSVLVTERTNELLLANIEIHNLNESLEARAEHAELASRAKSAFLANMSHEIRTPLNAVIGLNQLLQKDVHEPRQADRLRKSGQAANHLLALINDILDLSKIEADRITLEHSDFALAHVFETISGLMSPKATEKKLSWHAQIDRHIPALINGDAIRVQQVLLNFASNALKFTEQGSIDLGARLIEQCADELRIRFEIRDTGIGIAEEAQQRLFQSFEQADVSTTRKYGGTGLGLAISRRLAHLMHGEVGVISAPNSGSTFWFEAKFHASNAKPALQHLPLSLIQRRALVVHENEALGAEVVRKLAALKIRAYPTKSVREAKTRLETARRVGGPYDFVLLSDRLALGARPGELSQLKDQEGTSNPAIFLIGEGTQVSTLPPTLSKLLAGSILLPFDPSLLHDLLLGELTRNQAGYEDEIAYVAPQMESITLHTAHILLVDDNEINQEIARDMLSDAGLTVSLAANGQQALDMVREHTYDVVLMDMQMPVMDGLEATQAIRLLPAYATTPIIAMTANAFSEDKARCLAAGMNDHVAKPFTMDCLLATLRLWLPAQAAENCVPASVPAPDPANLPALRKVAGLDVTQGLKTLSGKTDAYLQLISKFIDHHHDAASAIRTALAEGNRRDAQRFAHSVKGAGGMIGAVLVAQCAGALETTLNDGAAETYIEQLLLAFEDSMSAFCKAVTQALANTAQD
jgi:two-component system sensor histidine kinase/response regulator